MKRKVSATQKKNDVSSLSTYHKIVEQNLMIIVHEC